MNPIERIEQELKKCVKCGACRAHCPAFSVMQREPVAARGKVALAGGVLSGAVRLDARTRADMSKCLLCGRCVQNCANEVPADLIVLAAREALAKKRGLTPFHWIVGRLLRHRVFMNKGALLASLFAPVFLRKIPASSGLRLRFPIPYIGRNRTVPKIASRPFLERYPEIIPGDTGRPSIVFFVGCMTNYIYPEIGEAAVALLKHLGCTIIIPKDQHCCGFPALSGGDIATFNVLAERNLESLEKHQADHIMTACASCGGAFHRMYRLLLAGRSPDLADRCRALADKAVDASVLLDHLGWRPEQQVSDPLLKITYHDPCHLLGRGITRQPRDLLRKAVGDRLLEMDKADSCCGLGGTFNVHQYGPSMGINAVKTEAILNSGAGAVATGCPGCMLQITDGLRRKGMRTRVLHTLQVLARSIPKR
jgi:glycolate oxidase iron-sulfur subunit